jgi:hypothetical protein
VFYDIVRFLHTFAELLLLSQHHTTHDNNITVTTVNFSKQTCQSEVFPTGANKLTNEEAAKKSTPDISSNMDPKTKRTKAKTMSSTGKGRKPNGRRSNTSESNAKSARTPPRRIDIQVKHVLASMHSSQQAYPGHPPPSPQHAHPGYPHRKPPAYSQHLPSPYAATGEIHSKTFADDYPGAYPDFQRPGGVYIPPLSAREIDYHQITNSLQTAASYPLVGMLPSLGQYPGTQPPIYPSYLQPPILQLPVYSIGHIYQPPYSPSFQSLYQPQPQPTAEQQLLQYIEYSMPADSSCPGLFELPTRQNNEYETMFGPQLPSHGLSLADATRKFDEILGKRADQRTDEEKKFREDHLAARQSVHVRDATDRKRRRQMDRIPSCPEE